MSETRESKPKLLGAGIVVGFLGSISIALLVAVLALFGLRGMTDRQRDARDKAALLADIERLRLTLEQRVSSSRGYLLTQDPALITEIEEERMRFDARRIALATAHPQLAPAFAEIEKLEQTYHAEIVATNKLRASTPSGFTQVFESVRAPLREKRIAVEQALSRLAASTRGGIEAGVRDSEQREKQVTIIFIGAVVILAVAAIFGLGVTRQLRKTLQREQELRASAEGLAREVVEQSKEVEGKLREVSAELAQLRGKRA